MLLSRLIPNANRHVEFLLKFLLIRGWQTSRGKFSNQIRLIQDRDDQLLVTDKDLFSREDESLVNNGQISILELRAS